MKLCLVLFGDDNDAYDFVVPYYPGPFQQMHLYLSKTEVNQYLATTF